MSKFKRYAIATVSEPKTSINDAIIQVTLDEIHPFEDGDKISSEEEYTARGVDRLGIAYEAKISADKSVEAIWMRDGNRATPPDVQRGEKVQIYRNDNDENLYWSELGIGDVWQRRKQETIVFVVAADGSSDEKTVHTAENCYTITVSGHNRVIILDMPKVAGAKGAMRVTLDQSNGVINTEIMDVCSVKMTSEGTINASINGGAEFDMDQGDVTLRFDNLTLEGSNATFNVGSTSWKGNVDHKGTFTNTGKMTSNNVSVDKHEQPVVGGVAKAPTPGT